MKIKIIILLAAIGALFSFTRPAPGTVEAKPAGIEALPSNERQPLQPFALEDEDQFD